MRRSFALALVLAACGQQPPEVVDEVTRRAAYARALSEREGHLDAWSLNSRADISFEGGMSKPTFVDNEAPESRWYESERARDPALRGDAVRWMTRTAHFRVRGTTDMMLELRGKVFANAIVAQPRLEITVDGGRVESTLVDADGSFATRTVVKRETIGDWVDVYATFSSVEASGDPEVARLDWVGWEPVSTRP